MKCEWKTYTVQELVDMGWLEEPMDGNHGSIHPKASDYVSSGVPFIMANDLVDGKVNYNNCVYITEKQASGLRKGFAKPGDVLLTHKATIGRTAIVPDEYDTIVLTPQVTYYRAITGINNQYLKYYFDTNEFQQLFANWAGSGSTRAYLGITAQRKLPIVLPPIEIQNKIVNILSALDDKITLNNKINENLQQQAFCIFEKLLTEVSGESILVSDIADLNPKRALTKNQIAKCIDMAQLSTSGAFPDGWVDKPFKGGMRFANGDTLLARITPCLENGKTAFIDFLNEGEVAFGSTEYIVLSPKEGIPPEFLYCLARYPAFVDYAVKNMNGSSGRQRVSAETIGQYSLPRLSDEQYQTFGELASPMFRKMKNNWMENMRLANVRDTLLPKLMAREIDISNFERSSSEKTSKEKRRFE